MGTISNILWSQSDHHGIWNGQHNNNDNNNIKKIKRDQNGSARDPRQYCP